MRRVVRGVENIRALRYYQEPDNLQVSQSAKFASMQRAPEEEIGFLLKRLMHVFRHLLEARLRQNSNMSFAHLVTLDQIHEEPGIAGAHLARRLLVTAQTMTELLKRLESEGSIERRPDPANRRADRWFLLPNGLERLQLARQSGAPVMTKMLSLLSPTEVSELRAYLERCVEGLERENRRDPPSQLTCSAITATATATASATRRRPRAQAKSSSAKRKSPRRRS